MDQPLSIKPETVEAPPRVRWDLRSSFVVRNAVIVVASIATLWALEWGKVFLIPCTVALCFTFWLMPLVDYLQRWHVPRALGAALVLCSLLGAIGFTGYTLRDDARDFAAGLPKAAHHARVILNQAARDPNGLIHHLRNTLNERTSPEAKSRNAPAPVEDSTDMEAALLRGSTTAMAAAANVGIVIFLIYLMLSSGDMFKRKLLAVIANKANPAGPAAEAPVGDRMSRKRVTMEILNEIGVQFQRYLAVLAVTNVVIGLLTWAAFSALGVEHAAVWGAAAAVLHIVPYVGPAVIAIASFLVTTLQFDSLGEAFIVAMTAVLIFGVIGMVLATWLAGRASKMNSVAVFIGLMFWGWLWGIPGLLLGTPLLMAMKVVADHIECLNWLGTFLSGAPKREPKAITRENAADEVAPSQVPASAIASITRVHADMAMTEGAALADPAFVAAEVASETTVIASDLSDEGADVESEIEDGGEQLPKKPKLFGVAVVPA